jgi:hypothetical protein
MGSEHSFSSIPPFLVATPQQGTNARRRSPFEHENKNEDEDGGEEE